MAFDSPLKATVVAEILAKINDNVTQDITPAELREVLNSCLDYAAQATDADNITEGATNKFSPVTATVAEAEAGTLTTLKSFTPRLVKRAIEALEAIRIRIDPTIRTNTFTVANRIYLVNLSGGSIALLPPTPVAGLQFGITDAGRSFSSTDYVQVRFATAGTKFSGNSDNILITKVDSNVIFEYVNSTIGWVVVRGSIS
jgi:hypothetical protein